MPGRVRLNGMAHLDTDNNDAVVIASPSRQQRCECPATAAGARAARTLR